MNNDISELEKQLTNATKRQADLVAQDLQDSKRLEKLQTEQEALIVSGSDGAKIDKVEAEIMALRIRSDGTRKALGTLEAMIQRLENDRDATKRTQALAQAYQAKKKLFSHIQTIYKNFDIIRAELELINPDINTYSSLLQQGKPDYLDMQLMNLQGVSNVIGQELNRIQGSYPATGFIPSEIK